MERVLPLTERSFEDLLAQGVQARGEGLVVLRDRDGLRHGAWIEAGYVVGVHVAGRFDPLLELLRRGGRLSADGHRSCVEALYAGCLRSGELATRVAGIPTMVVREALQRQVVARFAALCELACDVGYDAWLEPGAVPSSERSVRMPLGSLLRQCGSRVADEATHAERARRALRSLARALHPDLHPHLDADTRARLSEQLAQATAAYHGFAPKA